MTEIWKPFGGIYEASNYGKIRNAKTKRELRFFSNKDGYLRVQLSGNIGKTVTVHRIIAAVFIKPINGKPFINHKDGDKSNNRADNLEWCTRSENMKHAYENGLKRPPVGTLNPRCKLTYSDVAFIRNNYKPNDKTNGAKALAAKFGVARQTISAVACGQNWAYAIDGGAGNA